MANIIEERDPRGIRICCEESQWYNHISAGHPNMENNIGAIADTIRSPEAIYESTDSNPPTKYREVFCKRTENATYYASAPYTKVVVSVCGGSGYVITAYPAKKVAGGIKGDAIYIEKNGN